MKRISVVQVVWDRGAIGVEHSSIDRNVEVRRQIATDEMIGVLLRIQIRDDCVGKTAALLRNEPQVRGLRCPHSEVVLSEYSRLALFGARKVDEHQSAHYFACFNIPARR